jgi:hypothetical protein
MSIGLLPVSGATCFAASAKETHIFRQIYVDFRCVRIPCQIMTALSKSIDCAVNIVQGVRRAMNHMKKACAPNAEREEPDMGLFAAHVISSY